MGRIRGFSLSEVLVSLVLFTSILISLLHFELQTTKFYIQTLMQYRALTIIDNASEDMEPLSQAFNNGLALDSKITDKKLSFIVSWQHAGVNAQVKRVIREHL